MSTVRLSIRLLSVCLSVPEIIAIEVMGRIANTNLGEEEAVIGGRGWYRSKERWWVPTGPQSTVTCLLSLRVSEIVPLLCSSPTSSPPEISHGLWATKSEGVGLIVRAISFQDFQPMWSWSTNVVDRQTDRRTTCYNASPVKNCFSFYGPPCTFCAESTPKTLLTDAIEC